MLKYPYKMLTCSVILAPNTIILLINNLIHILAECRADSFITNYVKSEFTLKGVSKTSGVLTPPDDMQGVIFETIEIITYDNKILRGWYIKPSDKPIKQHILILHGNRCNRKMFYNENKFKNFAERGCAIFIPDYRDFGDSDGTFNITDVSRDIEAILVKFMNITQQNTINIMAYSLGTAIILKYLQLVKEEIKFYDNAVLSKDICMQINKIALCGPFTNTLAVMYHNNRNWRIASDYLIFPKWIIKNEFYYDNAKNIKHAIPSKTIIFHGLEDEVVPFKMGEQLANDNKIELIEYKDANHSDYFQTYLFYEDLLKFFDT